VQEVQQELDRLTNIYVEQAIQQAQGGNDEEVVVALRAARRLPGRNPDYFSAVEESISNIQESRIAAEQSSLERASLAAIQATTDWVDRVRNAISAGRLIAPAGESAVDYLAERESAEQKQELTNELVGALISECTARIDFGNLSEAEQLLDAAAEFTGDSEDTQALRDDLEQAYMVAESSKVLKLDDFVRLQTTSARYPRRAAERGIEGWVEVLFTVSPSGETTDISIQQATPDETFNKAAIDAVDSWTFEPRVYRGQTINQRAGARLVFKLQ
jgi:TonB family protein